MLNSQQKKQNSKNKITPDSVTQSSIMAARYVMLVEPHVQRLKSME